MSKRTKQQINGDIARSEVELIFAQAEWATDRVASDYGEDLVVQPVRRMNQHTATHVESFRLLVQVKGREGLRSARETWNISVKNEHVARWIRLAEPFLFVVWSPDCRQARYCHPKDQVRVDEVRVGDSGSTQLQLHKRCLLTTEELGRIAWTVRQDILLREILLYDHALEEIEAELKELRSPTLFSRAENLEALKRKAPEIMECESQRNQVQRALNQVLDDFLESLGVLIAGQVPTSELSKWPSFYYWLVDDLTGSYDADERYYFGLNQVNDGLKRTETGELREVLSNRLAVRLMDFFPSPPERPLGEI